MKSCFIRAVTKPALLASEFLPIEITALSLCTMVNTQRKEKTKQEEECAIPPNHRFYFPSKTGPEGEPSRSENCRMLIVWMKQASRHVEGDALECTCDGLVWFVSFFSAVVFESGRGIPWMCSDGHMRVAPTDIG